MNIKPPTEAPHHHLTLDQLAEVLVKHFGLTEGLYELTVGMNVTAGSFGMPGQDSNPGVMMTVAGLGLSKAEKSGPRVVDAAAINPQAKPKRRRAV